MKNFFTLLLLFLLSPQITAQWHLYDSHRSYIAIYKKQGIESTNWYTLWNSGTGTFEGSSLGHISSTTDELKISAYDVKIDKTAGGDVTGCTYYYVIYEAGNRPSSPAFVPMVGGWIENIGGNSNLQKWGASTLSYNLLTNVEPGKTYSVEVYGSVAGNNPAILYDSDNGSNYIATFTTDGALPVELTSLTAFANKSDVVLKWSTATEVNNYGFEIERQSENIWHKLGFVKGSGNSNSTKNYTFTDAGAPSGNLKYRLKQIDTDGTYNYSNETEVLVNSIPDGFLAAQNYPNPFNPTTTIKFGFEIPTTAIVTIYDQLGNRVQEIFNGNTEAGKIYNIEFNGSGLASGIYYYTIATPQKSRTVKMLLMK